MYHLHIPTDRQRDRQTYKQTERQTERQTDRHRQRLTVSWTFALTDQENSYVPATHTDRQTDKHKQPEGQTDTDINVM